MKRIFDGDLIRDYIQKHQLYNLFDEEMLSIAQLHHYNKGESILVAASEAEYFYLLVEGRVKVAYPFENGKAMVMKFYKDLMTLGDIELLQNVPVCCNVDAVEQTFLLAFPIDLIRRDFLQSVKLLSYLADLLSKKLQATINNTSYNSVYPLSNRVASYLIGHLNEAGEIQLMASYAEIAEFLGTTYRHLNRTLSDLEAEGVIMTVGKVIRVTDEEVLHNLSKNPYQQSL